MTIRNSLYSFRFLVFLSFPMNLFAQDHASQPVELKTEYQVNPLGLDQKHPRFFWQLNESQQGAGQTAYQIWVGSDSLDLVHGHSILWDSHQVSCDSSVRIVYQGQPLQPMHPYFWRVRIWDQKGKISKKSKVASFATGIFHSNEWKATWISGPFPKDSISADQPAPLLRRSFLLSKKIKSAFVYATALGSYVMYLNGEKVGRDILDPGWTDYRKELVYQTFVVTNLLRTGENALGVLLGKGWYGSPLGWTYAAYNFGPPPIRFLMQMKITFTDGSVKWIYSDSSWKTSPGPIQNATIYDGETIDERKDQPGWNTPEFRGKGWKPVQTPRTPEVPLVSQYAPTIQITRYLHPVSRWKIASGKYVFDLGQNMVGWVRLKVRGKRGDTIQVRHAEVLLPDRHISTINLRRAKATDTYILKDSRTESLSPHFTYHGFRYVEVSGLRYPPSLDLVTGCVFHTAAPPSGTFHCSSPLVNQLWKNITWGERGNLESIPTDCPQRDERLGWMGDAQTFWKTAAYNRDLSTFSFQWSRVMREAQSVDGSYSDVSPRVIDRSDGAPGWADAGIIIPWTAFHQYGDTRILQDNWASMEKYMDYILRYNPDFLRTNKLNNNFGDWLPAGSTTPNSTTPGDLIGTAYWAMDATLMSKMAMAQKNSKEAEKFQQVYAHIKTAFQNKFIHPDGTIGNGSQTSIVLALKAGLLDKKNIPAAIKNLVASLHAHQDHLATGFLGTAYILPMLSQYGENDLAYQLVLTDTYPSWGYMIKNGATTMWERWNGNTGDPSMNSYNHYSLGSVGGWMYQDILGIISKGPGFKDILIRPRPGRGISFAKGSYATLYGKVSVDWKILGEKFYLQVTIPPETHGLICLPTTVPSSIRENNQPLSLSYQLDRTAKNNGMETRVKVPSGTYQFLCTIRQ
ncbi:MAG: family 78 glycoside hydrolase catalytic domain [Chitinophagaceae bacterium]